MLAPALALGVCVCPVVSEGEEDTFLCCCCCCCGGGGRNSVEAVVVGDTESGGVAGVKEDEIRGLRKDILKS